MKITIYVDVLIIINFLINTILLNVSAKLSKVDYKTWRLLTSGFISALFSLIIFLEPLHILFISSIKIVLALIIIFIAFGFISLKRFLKLFFCFFLSTFIFGGTISGIWLFVFPNKIYLNNQAIYFNINIFSLFLLVCICYFFISVYKFFIDRGNVEKGKVILEINLNGLRATVNCLLDTGNNLKDPLTGKNVIVCEYEGIKNLLPNELKDILNNENNKSVSEILYNISQNNISQNNISQNNISQNNISQNNISQNKFKQIHKIRFHLIPYKVIENDGMILGFSADKIKIISQKDELLTEKAIIGIVFKKISKDYNGLFNPNII